MPAPTLPVVRAEPAGATITQRVGPVSPGATGGVRGGGGTAMARRDPLTNEQRRLLMIAARMPLASVANLAPVLGLDEEKVRRTLGALRRGGWVASVVRGMTERRQHRWFLTRRAVDLLYVTDHQHPTPREEARASGLAALRPEGELPEDHRERFALDHDHPAHLESQDDSPFAPGDSPGDSHEADGGGPGHEHPPWTATSRGIETSLRRLAMLEPVYRLAPDLLRSGRVSRPPGDTAASRETRMTDFRLLRHGGFYHAVARYGADLWTPFTYAGLHATQRALRRKGAAPLLGRRLLFPRGGPEYPHRQPGLLRGPGPAGGTLGPDRGGP